MSLSTMCNSKPNTWGVALHFIKNHKTYCEYREVSHTEFPSRELIKQPEYKLLSELQETELMYANNLSG